MAEATHFLIAHGYLVLFVYVLVEQAGEVGAQCLPLHRWGFPSLARLGLRHDNHEGVIGLAVR